MLLGPRGDSCLWHSFQAYLQIQVNSSNRASLYSHNLFPVLRKPGQLPQECVLTEAWLCWGKDARKAIITVSMLFLPRSGNTESKAMNTFKAWDLKTGRPRECSVQCSEASGDLSLGVRELVDRGGQGAPVPGVHTCGP